ncbi:MAG: transporter permease [Lachnospiraceae bacterium]|jgi:ABC-2 type transport system permease protein|nr:transporter permease [Lachnospiraceae bacterium]
MQVFKLYFKLLRSVATSLLLYSVIFVGITVMQTVNRSDDTTGFKQEKIDTAIVNYNEDSPLVQGLMEYLSEYCNFADLGDEEDELQDALFFRQVEYILTIPYGFGEEFIAGLNVGVEKKTVPNAVYATTVDEAINTYLNTARMYLETIPDITEEELVTYVNSDLEVQAQIEIHGKADSKNHSFYMYYTNFAAYIIMSGCLIGVSLIMLSFHNINIRRRNLVSPITLKSLNIQLMEGNLIFVLGYDLLLIVLGYILNSDKTINTNVIMHWLNIIVFSVSALSISYLAAMLVKSKQANEALSVILPLGLSFISGTFVPQFLLGDSVLHFASFAPVYWFVKANDTIASISTLNITNAKPILYYMVIQLGFAVAFFALSMVISKNRMQREY